jgi:hypothetical protein
MMCSEGLVQAGQYQSVPDRRRVPYNCRLPGKNADGILSMLKPSCLSIRNFFS